MIALALVLWLTDVVVTDGSDRALAVDRALAAIDAMIFDTQKSISALEGRSTFCGQLALSTDRIANLSSLTITILLTTRLWIGHTNGAFARFAGQTIVVGITLTGYFAAIIQTNFARSAIGIMTAVADKITRSAQADFSRTAL